MTRPTTDLVHGDSTPEEEASPLTTPIHGTTTFLFKSAEELRAHNEGTSSKYIYSRYANPTVASVERTLARLDGAESAALFSSGMAATTTVLLAHLRAGDEVVCASAVYGGTLHLLTDVMSRCGVDPRFVSLEDLTDPARLLSDRTRLVWFESPTNPTLRCVDVRAVAAACRDRGVLSVMDNTFATPINQLPLRMGIDLVMQSATKYLNGHSDISGGCVAGPRALVAPVYDARRLLGTIMDPHAAYALGRGLKTLPLRMDRHNRSGQAVAEFLARDARVSAVSYPGLPTHPDHAIARQQMSGFGGVVCFDLDGRQDLAERVYDRVTVIRRAASLGGVESLMSVPVLTSHWGYRDDQLLAAGVTKGMLRVSVGLEDVGDVIDDLDQALSP